MIKTRTAYFSTVGAEGAAVDREGVTAAPAGGGRGLVPCQFGVGNLAAKWKHQISHATNLRPPPL